MIRLLSPRVKVPPSWITVPAPRLPLASAAIAMKGLKVLPGG